MSVVAIVQARMSSTRLPRKVLSDIAGRPMLDWVVTRARRARRVARVVVATSRDPADDAIVAFCADRKIPCVRGSLDDVLDRYHEAARVHEADTVVRITADCPFVDPSVINDVVEAFTTEPCDYAANINPPTFPDGLDTEVFSHAALEQAWHEARLQSEREHVTPYMRNRPDRFRQVNVAAPRNLSAERWTVDEPADLSFANKVACRLGRIDFDYRDVLDVLDEHPELREINARIERDAGLKRSLLHDEVVR